MSSAGESRAGQGRGEQCRAVQGRGEQGGTGERRAVQGRAVQGRGEMDRGEQGRAGQERSKARFTSQHLSLSALGQHGGGGLPAHIMWGVIGSTVLTVTYGSSVCTLQCSGRVPRK